MLVVNCSHDKATQTAVEVTMRAVASEHKVNLVISDFPSATELAGEIGEKTIAPDIAIIDADDPNCEGISGGQALRTAGFRGILIIVSQTDDYALPAFDVGAFNYALKSSQGSDEDRFRRIFLQAMAQVLKTHRKYLMLNGVSERHNVPIDSILYFEIKGRICTAYFINGTSFDFIATLDELEARLSAYGFVRTHRSYMVNVAHVAKCQSKMALLDDGTDVPIGRSRHDQVFQMVERAAGGRKPDAVEIRDNYLKS